MKTKNLALAGGILGVVGGIALLLGPFFLVGSIVTDASISSNIDDTQATMTMLMGVLFLVLKIAILAVGIVSILYYKGSNLIKPTASILLIVAGGISLIPLLGFVGGIIAIIGGAIFLANLKNFKIEETT